MEPVTHFLTGACLARAGFNRKTALATVTMTLAAEAPDLDVLAYFKSSVYGFAQHRGATHTVWGIPLLSGLVLALVFAGHKLRRRFRALHPAAARKLEPRWGVLYLGALIAGYSHLLLDFTNSYGLRPLWPWWPRWYAWDIVFIIEPVMLAVLAAGLALPGLFALINQEIGARQQVPRGRTGAIAALLLIVALWGVRDFEHRRALHAMDALEYQGRIPVRRSALPYMANPFLWYGVVDNGDAYVAMNVDSLTPAVDSQGRARIYYKPAETAASKAAMATSLGKAYLGWARYPLVETEALDAGYVVQFHDLRFLYPDSRGSALGAFVMLSPSLQLKREGFYGPLRNREAGN